MSQNISQNNKRIAKNTLALYFRTFITMIVGLYTGRVMLQALGVDDYGVNNVVGGIVAMSSLITGSMSQAISRYITYTIGLGDEKKLKAMFSTSVNAQIIMSIIVILLIEIIGLWFLVSQANIPENRIQASHWVFQCSLLTLMISLISTPYNALLVAHEHMGIFAYTSIAEVVFKLLIVFIIQVYDGDRLILFSILNVMVSILMFIFYLLYCSRKFKESHYNIKLLDIKLLKELTAFSGWNMLNNGAWVFATQGVNMLVNVFFGVSYNAARGIAQTVNGAFQGFVNNFTVAFSPQITKSYAANDKEYAILLAKRGTKYSWLLTFIFIVPVFLEADTILQLWLGHVPQWSVMFLRFSLFESLAITSGQNLFRLIQADGNVKMYIIQASLIVGLIFIFSLILYIMDFPVWVANCLFIINYFILNIVRVYNIKKIMTFSMRIFIHDTVLPCFWVSLTAFLLPLVVNSMIQPGILRFIINVPLSVLWTCLCCIIFGLNNQERLFLFSRIKPFYKK